MANTHRRFQSGRDYLKDRPEFWALPGKVGETLFFDAGDHLTTHLPLGKKLENCGRPRLIIGLMPAHPAAILADARGFNLSVTPSNASLIQVAAFKVPSFAHQRGQNCLVPLKWQSGLSGINAFIHRCAHLRQGQQMAVSEQPDQCHSLDYKPAQILFDMLYFRLTTAVGADQSKRRLQTCTSAIGNTRT